jgi:hypothetical protein
MSVEAATEGLTPFCTPICSALFCGGEAVAESARSRLNDLRGIRTIHNQRGYKTQRNNRQGYFCYAVDLNQILSDISWLTR